MCVNKGEKWYAENYGGKYKRKRTYGNRSIVEEAEEAERLREEVRKKNAAKKSRRTKGYIDVMSVAYRGYRN